MIDLIITTKYCRGNSTTFPNRHNKLRERALPSAVNISRFSPWGLRFSPWSLRCSPWSLRFSPWGLRFSPWGLRSSFLGLRFKNTRRQTLLTKHRGRKEAATKYYNYTANKAYEEREHRLPMFQQNAVNRIGSETDEESSRGKFTVKIIRSSMQR